MLSLQPSDAPSSDVEALIAGVAELERSQQEEDVLGFVGLFAPEAVWVTGGGVRLIGLEVIGAFTQKVLPGAMAEASVTYNVEHIMFITPDVALTGVRQQYVDQQGEPTAGGMPSYVWRRTGSAWSIVAGQNTGIAQDLDLKSHKSA